MFRVVREEVEAAQLNAYAEGRKDQAADAEEAPEALAGRLIDAWCASHDGQIPWAKAIEIVAILTEMPEAERERLLALD